MNFISLELLKILHLFSLIAWMAGLFYLPRLFVYHVAVAKGGESPNEASSELFKTMERRLLRGIMNPAMIGTWVFGFGLMAKGDYHQVAWLHAKITLVVIMTIAHMMMASQRKKFEQDKNQKSTLYFRVFNEVPTILLILILILVIFKPF